MSDARSGSLADLRIDPATPGFFLRPDYYEVLARLRAEDPFHEFAPGIKAVTRYADIREISRDPERFCSGRGVLMNDPLREGGSVDGSILHMDPPQHTEWRKLLNREFTARALGRLEDGVRSLAAELLDALPRGEVFDLVAALTAQMPVLVICDLLGVPDSVRSDFRRWSDAAIVASDSIAALSPEAEASVTEMVLFLDEFAKDKAASPADDITSLLVAAEVDAVDADGRRKLTSGELITFLMSLVVAGNETTRHLMSGSFIELAARPDERDLLYFDVGRIPGAVEECLRWITPIQQFARTATRDTEIGSVAVSEGDYLVMLYSSGNRDEEAFGETAGELDLWREPGTANLAFGFGQHLCLGAALARMEARVLFEELAARRSSFSQAGDAEYLPSSLVRGPHTLPMVFD
jgi:cytochrome P450